MEFEIVPFHDPDRTLALERAQGWLRDPREVLRRYTLKPHGFFAAIDPGGDLVGHSSLAVFRAAPPAAPGLSWLGGMVVPPERQRKGIGRALLHNALKVSQGLGVALMGLDATDTGQPLYESEGFRVVSETERWQRHPRRPAAAVPSEPAALYPVAHCEIMDLMAYDAPRFGANRAPWLSLVMGDLPHRAFVAFNRGSNRIVGFVLGQEEFVGPLVADDADVARQLLLACEAAGTPPRVHVCLDQKEALELLWDVGYEPTGAACARMVRGGGLPGRRDTQWAAGAWALG